MGKFKRGFYTPVYLHKYIQPVDKHMNKSIIPEYRSGWELKFMQFCDANSSILKWGVEPFAIEYISPKDNRPHRYYVDGYIEFVSGDKFLVEIKPKAQCFHPKTPKKITPKSQQRYQEDIMTYLVNQAKWNAARKFAEIREMRFIILTETELGV